uniref:SURF4-domain-containing protein n=1 Tax=Mycena chlorophos TaxID=658473 RepID=A0ABQ0KVN4_MYCCL|nr:predicted protein [Mycena chlorophos]
MPTANPNDLGNGRPDSWLGKLQALSRRVEEYVDGYSRLIATYFPAVGRVSIVATFLEDAFRIAFQWTDQIWYLERYRKFPGILPQVFLIANIAIMFGASTLIVVKRYTEPAVMSLVGVILLQAFGYGLFFDLNFLTRNLSLVGGLLMLLPDAMVARERLFPGLHVLNETVRRRYFLLTSRVLIIALFLGFVIQGEWTTVRIGVSVLGIVFCILVVVGFTPRVSSTLLVLLLSAYNVWAHGWWALDAGHPARDFLKYDFFQTLSIIGGLIMFVNFESTAPSTRQEELALG